MPCYEPPPLVPHWLLRLAQATLGAICLLGLLASIWIALYLVSAIAGALCLAPCPARGAAMRPTPGALV